MVRMFDISSIRIATFDDRSFSRCELLLWQNLPDALQEIAVSNFLFGKGAVKIKSIYYSMPNSFGLLTTSLLVTWLQYVHIIVGEKSCENPISYDNCDR